MSQVVSNTPVEQIPGIVEELRATFATGKTQSLEYRKKQLKQFAYLMEDNAQAFIEAIKKDLGRPEMETAFGEVISFKNEVIEAVQKLSRWASDDKPSKPLAWKFHKLRVRKEPKGTVLVMGAWNYPITVQLGPVVGAIAAGNTVVLKPSELAEHSAQLIAELVPKYMDPETFRVVNGGIEQSSTVLDQRFEHIFYTGNGRVGRIVGEKAARWLCPVTLELGGKSPVIVHSSANLRHAAHRILWAKTFNAGQTCIAPDYVLVERSVRDRFVEELRKAWKEFYPQAIENSPHYGRIINERHYKRLHDLISNTKGNVVIGGTDKADPAQKLVPFTVVQDPLPDDPVMQEEIFGPVLPLIQVEDVQSAVNFINERDQPLALYIFSNSKPIENYILTYTRSGGVVHNDLLVHYTIAELPFGGTGPAGYGSYHGKYGFDCFTHERALVSSADQGVFGAVLEKVLGMRYPPYTKAKLKFFIAVLAKPLLFGRPQNPTVSNTSVSRVPPYVSS